MSYDTIPVPDADLASAEFFAALDAGRLQIRRCTRCQTPHLSVIVCDECGGEAFVAEEASGKGTVHAVTKVHMAHHPAFADLVPVSGGIVELAEGPRLFAPLLGPGPFHVGQAVTLDLLAVGNRKVAGFRG